MARPLPRILGSPARPTDAHWGLWYDKFFDQWRVDRDKGGAETWSLASVSTDEPGQNPRLRWICTLPSALGRRALLEEHATRLAELTEARGGRVMVLKTTSPFATGLGRPHPIENGLTWHPTLGVPFLPGSSLKGLVRAWAREEGHPVNDLDRLFGGRDEQTDAGQVGALIVMDALPIEPVSVGADVMTPHYGAYLQSGETPGDWLSPTPIPFLVVTPGVHFVFALIARRLHDATMLDQAEEWLLNALIWAGAGAKGAVGYGRFARVELEDTAWGARHNATKRAAWLARATPVERWRHRIDAMGEADCLDLLGAMLRGEFAPDEEQEAALTALRTHPLAALWREGKTNATLNLGPAKIKERAALLLTEGDRMAAAAPDPKEEFDALLATLDSTSVVNVLEGVMKETSFPKAWLQTLLKKAKSAIGKKPKRHKADAVEAFEAWVKRRQE